MSRPLPNINIASTLKKRDRLGFKDFVLQVNTDTFVYQYTPNSIELTDGVYFTLYLTNKRFIFDILEVDNVNGVKQPQDRYDAIVTNTDIIITFVVDITRLPAEVTANDFEVKGKIAEIE